MSRPLSYQPPARDPHPSTRAVRRRHVVYVPGYDPAAETRARMLFVREVVRYAKRFGLSRVIGKADALPDAAGLRWQVDAGMDGWSTQSTIDVLRWDDIVRRDFARPVVSRVALLLVGFAHGLLSGALLRFFRANWKFGGVIVYPVVMIALLAALSLGLGAGAAIAAGTFAPVPTWGQVALGIAVAGGLWALATPNLDRWFVWHLLHDWVFNWQHGNGWRPDYEARVDRFAAHLVELARTSQSDEILVIGHSSGSVMAVETVARAFARDPLLGRRGPALALLTIGACIPLVAFVPRARRCREAIARLVAEPSLLWAEYQAPQDWMNFPGFNPVEDLGLAVPAAERFNPVIRSARFRDIMTDTTYRAVLRRPFRMHFQYLMANERAGEYDYVMIVCGPTTLAERVSRPEMHVGPAAMPDPVPDDEGGDEILQRVLEPSDRAAPNA